MNRIKLIILIDLLIGIISISTGQVSPVSVELFGGAGFLANPGGTFNEFNGGYAYPAADDGRQLRTYYSTEYQGSYFFKLNVCWRISERFSIQLANQFVLPRYDFNNTFYAVNAGKTSTSAPPSGFPSLRMANSCYYYTPALGIRANLFRRIDSPYLEVLYGRTFRHLDLERNDDYYPTSGFFQFSRLRDRSSRAYMQIGIGTTHSLSNRCLLHLRIGLDTIHESGGGLFFLEESGQYLTFDGSIGIGYRF
ncbi:MAG TPA: hypothetical protein PKY55_14730 [bacterium]|jgi:hypothetical protein|nr:hypothetical protein [bacterium]